MTSHVDPARGTLPAVATLGEGLIRLFPGEGYTLEQSHVWRVSVGGAEANVAIALARLGVEAYWVSRLPRNPLGYKIASTLRAAGVDVTRVVWTSDGRVGTYLTETGITPEDLRIWYDRGGSTFASLRPDEISWDFLGRCGLIHFTGITPALGEAPCAAVEAAVANATARGLQVSLDVNYRSRLWPPEEARETLTRLFEGKVHLVICSRRDAKVLFGLDDDERAARWLRDRMGAAAVVVTRGAQGALAWDGRSLVQQQAYAGRIVDRIGRGDAFAAGVILGFLAHDMGLGLRRGSALAAIAQARWGDPLFASPEELEGLLAAGPGDRR